MTSYQTTTGATLYAKPYDDDSGYASPWDDDLITGNERQFGGTGTGVYDFALVSPKLHYIYEQLGVSPAGPDEATPDRLIGHFPAVTLLSRTWSGALLEAGESYSWPVDYPIEVTDPQVSVKVNGVEVATATASGTGTSFVFVFAVPAGVALGDTVLVETAEDQPRAVVTGQVVEATDTVEAEGFAQVLPGVALSEPRARETTLRVFLGETVQQSLTLYQSDGETPLSVDGKSLELVVETRDGADVAVYGGGDITISGDDDNIVSWSWTSPVTERRRTLQWTLRDDDTPRQVYARGAVDVIYAAKVDP